MSAPRDYQALLRQARHELSAATPPLPDPARLLAHIDRAEGRERIRRGALLGLMAIPLVLISLSVLLHPVVPWLCTSLTRGKIFRAALLPGMSVVASAALLWSREAGGQMLLRALLWSTLLLGAAASAAEPGVLPLVCSGGGLATGLILLLLGERGLEPERYVSTFVPVAHRDALTLVMVLMTADALTLITWTHASEWYYPAPGLWGLAMLVGVAGLYRLRAWALLYNTVVQLGAVAAAWLGLFQLPLAVVVAITGMAALQLAATAVVGVSIRRGEAVERPALARLGRRASRVVIVVLMGIALVSAWTASESWIAASCAR